MKPNKQYTLKEIAELAEVSRATVDRVINGRGLVAKETYEKIKLILDKIDYQPNLIAQTLRKGELHKIAILMPDSDYDKYWKRAIDGINAAIKEFSFIGINVEMHLFNPFKHASFQLHAKQVLKGNYSGVLIAPVFYKESIDFFQECKNKNLHYVTFNTHIVETNKLCHVGQDLIQSGEIAASLLHKLLEKNNEYIIIHIDEDIMNAKHMQEKETGFKKFLANKSIPKENIHVLKIDNPALVEKNLMKKIEVNPNIKGVFVSTSKVHFVADVIEAYSLNLKLVGYDLIEENIQQLNAENIDFLIYQNPGLQANNGISILVDHIAFKKQVPKERLLPIEIVIKENFKNYLKFV